MPPVWAERKGGGGAYRRGGIGIDLLDYSCFVLFYIAIGVFKWKANPAPSRNQSTASRLNTICAPASGSLRQNLRKYWRKYNHNHDELGRFASGPGFGGGSGGRKLTPDLPASVNNRISDAIYGNSRANPFDPATQFPNTPLREIQDYPQSGKDDWRTKNDVEFRIAATIYNAKYNLTPGDPGYRTPEFLKAWAMVESGSDLTKAAFLSDPFQVNNIGDYPINDDSKFRIAYLRRGQKMTPAVSAIAALEWLRFKGRRRDKLGRVVEIYNDEISLQNYNGRNDKSKNSGNLKHKEWYAAKVLRLAKPGSGS